MGSSRSSSNSSKWTSLSPEATNGSSSRLDNGQGGHFMWQMLVDDPQLIISLEDQYGEDWEDSGDASLDKYAYNTNLMNDVHMSHAMEFPYPQSMSNCDTCHEGELGNLLVEENFTLEACKSCHPVTGDPQNIMDPGKLCF